MQALVVSLDQGLETLLRLWVVAEIGEASATMPIFFRMIMQISKDIQQSLLKEKRVMQSVTNCHVTDPADKERILGELKNAGGIEAYDQFVNSMIEFRFGFFHTAMSADPATWKKLCQINELELDFSWQPEEKASQNAKHLASVFPRMTKVIRLKFSLKWCGSSFDPLERLTDTQKLESLNISLRGGDFADINAVRRFNQLTSVSLYFPHCSSLADISALGNLVALTSLNLSSAHRTKVADISALGN